MTDLTQTVCGNCQYPGCEDLAAGQYDFPHEPKNRALCSRHAEQSQEFHARLEKALTGALGDYERRKARGVRYVQLKDEIIRQVEIACRVWDDYECEYLSMRQVVRACKRVRDAQAELKAFEAESGSK
jgi:hypothetical protein